MTNCKHFVVRWAGLGNDTLLREKKNQTWGRESHGFFFLKKFPIFSDLFLIEGLLGLPLHKIPWPSPLFHVSNNIFPPPEKGSLLFFFAVAYTL